MLFRRSTGWRETLKECDHTLASSALMHYLAEHPAGPELAAALEGYFAHPGYPTALPVVAAEPELVLLFRECRPGGVYQRLAARA